MNPQTKPEGLPLGRRERRKLEVHARIIEVSLELFDARGVDATKVFDICESADIAHKTFFNHFPSKRHLLREIAGISLEGLLLQIEEARKQPVSTCGRVRFFFEAIAASAEEAGPMQRELLTELVHVAYQSGTGQEQTRQLHESFKRLIEDGLDAGDVNTRHDADTLTEMLTGAFYALTFNRAHLENYPVRIHAQALSNLLADAIRKED